MHKIMSNVENMSGNMSGTYQLKDYDYFWI